jgi:hypothetical protein
MDPVSHKRERFLTLAARRDEQVKYALRLIGNLSGHAYEWHPDEVMALFAGVREAVDAAEHRFLRPKKRVGGQPVRQHATQ